MVLNLKSTKPFDQYTIRGFFYYQYKGSLKGFMGGHWGGGRGGAEVGLERNLSFLNLNFVESSGPDMPLWAGF